MKVSQRIDLHLATPALLVPAGRLRFCLMTTTLS